MWEEVKRFYMWEEIIQKGVINKNPLLYRHYDKIKLELSDKIREASFELRKKEKNLSEEEQKKLALEINLKYFSENPDIPEIIKARFYLYLFNPF